MMTTDRAFSQTIPTDTTVVPSTQASYTHRLSLNPNAYEIVRSVSQDNLPPPPLTHAREEIEMELGVAPLQASPM